MKLSTLIQLILTFLLTTILVVFLSRPLNFGSPIPPLGKFLNPFHGFWQGAENHEEIFDLATELDLESLQDSASVVLDDRLVPHIFAHNNHDLYFLQGYVTAKYRLWQMELQTHAAAGRLSEILGDRMVEYDKLQRRRGMVTAAERALATFEKYPESKLAGEAYSAGVNAYIESLSYADLPIEYKLLNYVPEKWTPLKMALLGKSMAADLTFAEADVEMSNVIKLLGKGDFEAIFPDYPADIDPVAPTDTKWNFEDVITPTMPDSSKFIPNPNKTATRSVFFQPDIYEKPIKGIGSNNWAVNGQKTASGKPILCSDPHLGLNLPSIWYEIQLQTPEVNAYGVSLPGAPGVVIGFNDSIAWGMTNAGRDVLDWYQVTFKNDKKAAYLYDGKWIKSKKKIEEIKVKNGATVYDTVTYTQHGPIVYEDKDDEYNNMAMRWKAHDKSNDLLTFHYLNRAKNYDEYLSALQYYECPAQNFVFASQSGDIAIWQQGKFPLRHKGQGRTVQDGSTSQTKWQGFIPSKHNPHSVNPPRNYVSSANQHAADQNYPYYFNGDFEHFRNRRLNQRLDSLNNITAQDMMQLQNDNYNLQAAEILPLWLNCLDSLKLEKELELNAIQLLKNWDFLNLSNKIEPALYEVFYDKIFILIWDELKNDSIPLTYPERHLTQQLLLNDPNNKFFDLQATTDTVETAAAIIKLAFDKTIDAWEKWQSENGTEKTWSWADYKSTNIRHLARIPAFGRDNLPTNGYYHILNATSKYGGPSWRMVVELGEPMKAWGIYPGGQSGNVGSSFYDNMVDKWVAGEYFELAFLKNLKQAEKKGFTIQKMRPSK